MSGERRSETGFLLEPGWHRTYGNSGWYNGTYGGGWYMSDTTWIRAYNSKSVYTPGEMQATTVRGNTNLCIGSDCRTSWPSGAGDGYNPDNQPTATGRGEPTKNEIEAWGADGVGITAEADTLDSVCDRGRTTDRRIESVGLTSTGNIVCSGSGCSVIAGGNITAGSTVTAGGSVVVGWDLVADNNSWGSTTGRPTNNPQHCMGGDHTAECPDGSFIYKMKFDCGNDMMYFWCAEP